MNRRKALQNIALAGASLLVLDRAGFGQGLANSRASSLHLSLDDSTIVALGMECTHQQCMIGSFNGTKFRCPCHQSEFDSHGNRIAGPAQAPLDSFPTSIEGRVVTVTGLPGDSDWNLTSVEPPATARDIELLSVSPQPFRERLNIRFSARSGAEVRVSLIDSQGREVRRLERGWAAPGIHHLAMDVLHVSAGAYLLVLGAGKNVEIRHIVHLQ